jgi:hygromycin-B 4-O-kinase
VKTTYSQEDIYQFLEKTEQARPDSVEQLTEGHISQALGFETVDGRRFVLRIADHEGDFQADKYAGDVFGDALLAPKVTDIGSFGEVAYYCISKRAKGVPTTSLTLPEIQAVQPEMHKVFDRLFKTDISTTTGYGEIDTTTGDAPSVSWQAYLADHIAKTSIDAYKEAAEYVGIDPAIVDDFMAQFNRNLSHASEVRRLFHGDLGFDNLLVDDGKVTAVIDWAQMGYGDWMRDFARFEFWGPGRYGDAKEFAAQYDFEAEHIDERLALYHAYNALLTIDFSLRHKNASTSEWLREHVAEKLLS